VSGTLVSLLRGKTVLGLVGTLVGRAALQDNGRKYKRTKGDEEGQGLSVKQA